MANGIKPIDDSIEISDEISVESSGKFWIILEWALLLAGLAALTITEGYTWYVSLGVALLLGAFILRAVRTRQFVPATGLEIPWALGLFSAAFAAWMAYNPSIAWLQFSRLLAACVLYYAVVSMRPAGMPWLSGGFLLAAAALAVYWPTQTDYTSAPVKLQAINQAGAWLQSALPAIPGPSIHPNVAAGTLLAAVPVGLGLSWESWRLSRRKVGLAARSTGWLIVSVLAFLLTLVVMAGLILTSSRGAWLALAGAGILSLLAWIQRRWLPAPRQRAIYWACLLGLGALLASVVLLTGNFDRLAGQIPDPTGSLQSRTVLWKQGLSLIGDYPFTGSGLMTFWMVHGSYVLQIYIPYIAHVHNSFLEVWIEQGVVGALALLLAGVVILGWAWRALGRPQVSTWGWAGLAALSAVFLHGLVDVVFYVSRTLPVIGLVLGLAWWVNAPLTNAPLTNGPIPASQEENQLSPSPSSRNRKLLAAVSLAILLVAVVVSLFVKPVQAAWQANLGALLQTRYELSRYDPLNFEKRSIEDIRQESADPLAQAEAAYLKAVAIDPTNRTALQRLASLAFSRGNIEASLSYAQQLWQAGYRDATTRLLYGDALTATGQVLPAVEVLTGVTWAESRLMGSAWYRYWLNQDYERAVNTWSAVLLLNPKNQDAARWLKEAQAKLK